MKAYRTTLAAAVSALVKQGASSWSGAIVWCKGLRPGSTAWGAASWSKRLPQGFISWGGVAWSVARPGTAAWGGITW